MINCRVVRNCNHLLQSREELQSSIASHRTIAIPSNCPTIDHRSPIACRTAQFVITSRCSTSRHSLDPLHSHSIEGAPEPCSSQLLIRSAVLVYGSSVFLPHGSWGMMIQCLCTLTLAKMSPHLDQKSEVRSFGQLIRDHHVRMDPSDIRRILIRKSKGSLRS